MQQFSPEFFTANRLRLLESTDATLIVIAANALVQRSGDTTFPFRQESNFWYLTGIDEPEYLLVMTIDEQFLIAPKWDAHHDLWDGSVTTKALKEASGVRTVMKNEAGWERLSPLVKKAKKVHMNQAAAAYLDVYNFYTNPAQVRCQELLKKAGAKEFVNCKPELARLRQNKQPVELAALQTAIDITMASLDDVRAKLGKYEYEYQIEADITAGFRKRGASGLAYDPIVASGRHAATIHYVSNDGEVDRSHPLLLDVGAASGYYNADISRTWAFKPPTKRQQALHDAVMRVRTYALSQLKPGVMPRAYEKLVDLQMIEELIALKLLDDPKDREGFRKIYPHLTSHFLGLDVHDAADYERPLEAGMVLTVEPGIYLPAEKTGIRIEDDVLITDDGCKVLSEKLSRDLFLA